MAEINPVELQKALGGMDYPADHDTVVRHAREHGADEKVVEKLSSLEEKRFDGPDDVTRAVFHDKG